MNKFIAVAICLVASAALAVGHDQGGGGGGFCVNGVCKTLAEAGFKFKEEQFAEPVLTKDVFTELNAILKKIYLGRDNDSRMQNISKGDVDTFVSVEIADEARFTRAKEDYLKILKDNGVPTDNFELFAFSDSREKKTYLLPKFFSLNSISKAKILIHDGVVRTTGSLVSALRMDVAIESTLSGASDLVGVAAASGEVIKELAKNVWLPEDINSARGLLIINGLILDRMAKGAPYFDVVNSLSGHNGFDSRDAEQEADLFQKDPELWKVFKKYGFNSFWWKWDLFNPPGFMNGFAGVQNARYLTATEVCKAFEVEFRFVTPFEDEPAVVICKDRKLVGFHAARVTMK